MLPIFPFLPRYYIPRLILEFELTRGKLFEFQHGILYKFVKIVVRVFRHNLLLSAFTDV